MVEIFKFVSMNTDCEVQIYSTKKSKATNCAKEILKEAVRLEKKYNYFDKNSYLSKINQRKIKKIDNETKFLLNLAKKYYKKTNKVFDITIGSIKDLFYLNLDEKSFLKEKEKYNKFVGCENFEIKKNEIIFTNNFTKIDLGGIVKEYAVDRAKNIIQKFKIKSALINFGGDIYAVGKKINGEKFKIGIKNPTNPNKYFTFVELENEALTTSGNYERNYKIGNKIYSHILSKNDNIKNLSVSVISKSCLISGIYSTSLIIDDKIDIPKEIKVIKF